MGYAKAPTHFPESDTIPKPGKSSSTIDQVEISSRGHRWLVTYCEFVTAYKEISVLTVHAQRTSGAREKHYHRKKLLC